MCRPSGGEEKEAAPAPADTTPESIETIFRKYDQQYPFHGPTNDDDANVQNDEPVMQSIIERLNEILNDDMRSDFKVPTADASPKQRSLLRKQNEELGFGSVHLNQRARDDESLKRGNSEKSSGIFNLEQNAFFNKDLLADSYTVRPAVDRVPPKSRIPVRVPTRFPTRRPTTTSPTTTAAPAVFQSSDAGEKITELVAEEILKKPEGNKLSIPVLSVATEDFEEDLPAAPVVPVKPNKVSAQTDDFYDEEQFRTLRQRRDSEPASSSWFSRMYSWFNYYGETEEASKKDEATGDEPKQSALNKRQTTATETEVVLEQVPVPEEVKSADVPPQVSDAVIETILDIEDPQTRNEFAKDVPAIEEKLSELEEAGVNQTTVEVAIVELGQTTPEKLGTVVEKAVLPEINAQEDNRSEIADINNGNVDEEVSSSRSLEIVPDIIPITIEPVADEDIIATTLTPVLVDNEEELPTTSDSVIAVEDNERSLPTQELEINPIAENQENVDVTTISNEEASPESIGVPTEAEVITETRSMPISVESVEPVTVNTPEPNIQSGIEDIVAIIPSAPIQDTIIPQIVIVENRTVIIVSPPKQTDELETPSPSATPAIVDSMIDDPQIVIEPEIEEEPTPRLLPVSTTSTDVHVGIIPEATEGTQTLPSNVDAPAVQITKIDHEVIEEAVLLIDPLDTKASTEAPNAPTVISEEHETVLVNTSGSHSEDSLSVSTTESTSEIVTPFGGSSEEDDKDDQEKKRRKAEERRLKEEKERLEKEEKERLKKEEKTRKKALKQSSEEDDKFEQLKTVVEEKMTKEEMVNMFSSPEDEVRRLEPDTQSLDPLVVVSEVAETQKNLSMDHMVIKKDGVPNEIDDSEESSELTTTMTPDLDAQLNVAIQNEIAAVDDVLAEIQNAIDELTGGDTDAAAVDEVRPIGVLQNSDVELTNSVISSKNTRHLSVGYHSEDLMDKDEMPEAEARLTRDTLEGPTQGSTATESKAFVLVGSCVFLVVGFMLFGLVVLLVKRSGRHGSLDLTIEP